MTFQAIKNFILSLGGKEGSSERKGGVYHWAHVGKVMFYERSYSDKPLFDILFERNDIPEIISRYQPLLDQKGEEVKIIDYLVDHVPVPEERGIILRFLLCKDKTFNVVEFQRGFILRMDDGIRGVVYLNGRED